MTVKDKTCLGKVALVTGASRGIGAAIAERLAAEGARVALAARSLDRTPDNLSGTLLDRVKIIEQRGGRAIAIEADVADAESRAALVRSCEKQLGPIDILVNNAAAGPYKPFLDFTEMDFQRTYELNTRAPFDLCQRVLPGMRERQQGWIVNISSATAEHPDGPPYIPWHQDGGYHLYAASKAALNRFTSGLAAEFHRHNIAINTLSPLMAVITPGMEVMGVTAFMTDDMIEPVEAIAEAVVVLCSCDPNQFSGRVTYSLPLLEELSRPIRSLDGMSEFKKPRATEEHK